VESVQSEGQVTQFSPYDAVQFPSPQYAIRNHLVRGRGRNEREKEKGEKGKGRGRREKGGKR
jgi:hypothetical protein